MIWRIAVGLLVVGVVVMLFVGNTKAAPKGPVPVASTDDQLAATSGKVKGSVCRRMLLGNPVGL